MFCPLVVHTGEGYRAMGFQDTVCFSLWASQNTQCSFPLKGPYKGWPLSTVNGANDGSYLCNAETVISYAGNKCPCCVQ